jgi:hypothetical protein
VEPTARVFTCLRSGDARAISTGHVLVTACTFELPGNLYGFVQHKVTQKNLAFRL